MVTRSWRGNKPKVVRKKSKQLHQLFDYNHLLFIMQARKGEREVGVVVEEEVVKRIKLLGQVNIMRDTLGVDSNEINKRSKLAKQIERELAHVRRGKKLASTSTNIVSHEEDKTSSSDNDNGDEEEAD